MNRREPASIATRTAATVLAGLLSACGGAPAPVPVAVQPPAELRAGDLTVRATTLPTTQLNAAMARAYGVERDAGSVLLVVGLRRGPASNETSLPGSVSATATDLLGRRQKIALRAIDHEGYVDHVGVVDVSMPDTLRFRVDVLPRGAAAATLEFNRDFFPATDP